MIDIIQETKVDNFSLVFGVIQYSIIEFEEKYEGMSGQKIG